ncbi:hypothetical protein N9A89_05910, partial [Akkermansiaceae bacterium]|nr:hypothetical protein [Akkermansiaceae bacterium]
MIYDPASGNTTVSLRENETAGAGEIDDLFASDFVLGNSGEVVLMAPLRGPAITSGNDVALIRAGVTLLVEGGNLPTISSTATMGATFGASPVSISPNGRIAFLADFLEGAVSKKALFQIEEGVVFELAREGEALADGPGAAYQISSISSLLSAGPDDGYPSSLGAQDDIAVSFETGGSQSLTSRLYGLDDLDGDGLSNLIEAAIGGDAQNSADHLTQLPSLQELSGQRHYVFHQPTVAGLPAVVLEESADLESWSTVMGSATPTADQSGVPTGYERVSYPVSSSAVKRFLRVGVQSSAP